MYSVELYLSFPQPHFMTFPRTSEGNFIEK